MRLYIRPAIGRVRLDQPLARGADRAVPPALTERAIQRQPGARSIVYPELDHASGWEALWPEVLDRLDALLRATPEPPDSLSD